MKLPPYFMVLDVESIGLHGEAFAFGYVVIDTTLGAQRASQRGACSPNKARGTAADHLWVAENVPKFHESDDSPRLVRQRFWSSWTYWAERGAVLVADVAWPVEARFLAACIDDDPTVRAWQGPYPLHELTSIAMAMGADVEQLWRDRRDIELPKHDPLNDARQSARILVELLTGQRT